MQIPLYACMHAAAFLFVTVECLQCYFLSISALHGMCCNSMRTICACWFVFWDAADTSMLYVCVGPMALMGRAPIYL
jgi:hypothetical protein